jgi:Asp-tRNA(Asn)/Glu-tRNA(Gln) amidotransferase B subunit
LNIMQFNQSPNNTIIIQALGPITGEYYTRVSIKNLCSFSELINRFKYWED